MEESGSPHELGTSAMIRSPSRSAQYSLRGDSTFTCSDRKSTRLNSSHLVISYAVFCLKKKNNLVRESNGKDRFSSDPHAVVVDLHQPRPTQQLPFKVLFRHCGRLSSPSRASTESATSH